MLNYSTIFAPASRAHAEHGNAHARAGRAESMTMMRFNPARLLAAVLLLAASLPLAAQTIDICDRTPEVEAKILAALELTADDCAAVPADRMAAIARLSISRGSIAALRAGDFDNLTALEELNLWGHPLTTLPPSIFDNLTALKSLRLLENQLATLPAGIFDNLTALESLNLRDNRLAALPSGIFDKLTALEWLVLSSNLLATLPAGIFDNLTALESLGLSSNLLETLPPGIFDKLTALLYLNLNTNRLAGLTFEHALFANLHSLYGRPQHPLSFYQAAPPTLPPCQPPGGFPSEADGGCDTGTTPTPPPAPEPEPEPEPPDSPEPEPPAEGDLAGRIAALERKLAALERQAALDADESRETDAVHRHLIDGAAERLDAIEENMPPRRLRLWMPPPEE